MEEQQVEEEIKTTEEVDTVSKEEYTKISDELAEKEKALNDTESKLAQAIKERDQANGLLAQKTVEQKPETIEEIYTDFLGGEK